MNKERVDKIRKLFEAAVPLAPAAREAFLNEQCGEDTGTREFVSRMLTVDSRSGEILDSPVLMPRRREGERIDQYRVVREIGYGGTASVYLAVDEHSAAAGDVAIKILHGSSLSFEGLGRFTLEREILARLDHPNIARLIGGGTTADGHPYVVMEYVDGIPIRRYCSDRRLSVKERLSLFRQVCAAVQYAHQNLIVHRDLKPGNILVTLDGLVKLVDFGIAKPLEVAGGPVVENMTLTGMRPMTPDYASPEQISGGPISTLTDVFSLGVILYELLTGKLPHGHSSQDPRALIVSICRDEPARPSLAAAETNHGCSRQLKGEVDNVVMRALQKEPGRRYQSVEQFNDDIGRYLAGLPVLTQKDTFRYRSRKFLRRHRASVGAAGAVFVALVLGVVGTSISARTARLERARAERQAIEAQTQRRAAERRLAEMTQMAERLISLHDTVEAEKADAGLAAEVAQRTRDSLGLVLNEGVRDSALAAGFASATKSLSSYQDRLTGHWQVPRFWNADETIPHEYSVTIDHERVHRGNSSLAVRSIIPEPKGSVTVAQTLPAEGYRGNRIRVSAFVASRNVGAGAALWLRVKRPDPEISETRSGDTSGCRISGTETWRECSVTAFVPENATLLDFGIRFQGAGTIWVDDFAFEASGPITPLNLSFRALEKGQ